MSVSIKDLFEAGAHFGHRTRYWNPKMAPYIYGARGDIHIINLEKTVPMLNDAANFLGTIAASGGQVMFVGTKRSAKDLIEKHASDCGMPFVSNRWLGGMMTNFKTIKQSVNKLHKLRDQDKDGTLDRMIKKEAILVRKDLAKLESSLGGISAMKRLPDVLFVADVGHEHIAIKEARTLGIPVVGIVDTNNSPDTVDYIIPCNDDSVRALNLCVGAISNAISEAKASVTTAKEEDATDAAPAENSEAKAEKTTEDAAPEAKATEAEADKVEAVAAEAVSETANETPAKDETAEKVETAEA